MEEDAVDAWSLLGADSEDGFDQIDLIEVELRGKWDGLFHTLENLFFRKTFKWHLP